MDSITKTETKAAKTEVERSEEAEAQMALTQDADGERLGSLYGHKAWRITVEGGEWRDLLEVLGDEECQRIYVAAYDAEIARLSCESIGTPAAVTDDES